MIGWAAAAWAGSVSGVVRGPDAAPVAGALVIAQDPQLAWVEATSDADGRYTFTDLRAGAWRIRATPPQGSTLAETWAPSTWERCDADRLIVGDGAVELDVTLLAGAEVRGHLDVPRATVVVAPLDGATPREGIADDEGAFVVSGVPPGEVVVALGAPGWPDQFWGGAFTVSEAAVFSVAGGPLELGDTTLRPGARVVGTVTGSDGPVAGGTANAYAPSAIVAGPIGPDGSFALEAVPAGDVLAWAIVAGLATTYWPDADRPAGRVPVADGEEVSLDLTLPAEAVIRGRLAGEGPWEGATAVLYNSDQTIGLGAVVGADGSFSFGGLHGGDYTLWIDGAPGGRVSGSLLDEAGAERVLTVAAGSELDLGEVDLPEAATLSGRVTEAGTGLGVAGAYVLASTRQAARGTVTDADGGFVLTGLAAGGWEVSVGSVALCDSDDGWVEWWHRGTPNPLFADPLVLAPGRSARWDPQVPPDDDHDGMDDLWEQAHGLDPEVDDGALDPDQDGFDNLEEYLLGTDPTDEERRCGCASGPAGMGWAIALLAWRRRRSP